MLSDDPRKRYPTPPYPEPQKGSADADSEMPLPADHGESSYKGHGKLKGKVALITGGDSGIGRAAAVAFAREGADIVVSYLSHDADARDTARLVENEGQRCLTIGGDIGQEKHCIEVVDRCVGELGRLDVLLNNAAYQQMKDDLQDFTSEDIDRTFKTNIYSMFYLCKAALPHLQPGSSIINVTSVQAYQPSATLLVYATTKGAIVSFTKGLSELAIKKGVRVNAVAPGPIWTPLIPSTLPKEAVKQFGQDTPIGRAGQPAEVAPAFVFLASQDSSYITGEVIGVTGGMTMP